MTAREGHFGTVVLTGATSGIGEATARLLASRCERLVVLGPQPASDVREALDGIRRSGEAALHYVSADFTRLDAVRDAADAVRAATDGIDLLINDAGVPGAPRRILTEDGFERTLQVNALAPALFTRLLVPELTSGARVVNVGSSAHRVDRFDFEDIDLDNNYTPVVAYARAKLAMVTWSLLLSYEQAGTPMDVVALCPGLNNTPLSAAMMGQIGGPPSQGAQRVLVAATANVPSGSYLEGDRVVAPSAEVTNRANQERLTQLFWERLAPFAAGARS